MRMDSELKGKPCTGRGGPGFKSHVGDETGLAQLRVREPEEWWVITSFLDCAGGRLVVSNENTSREKG